MRAAYLIVLALVGCSTLSEPSLPKQPDAPTSPAVVAALETAQDKVDGKVAAAVTVAKENADKPAVVRSELGVALSLLDKPSDSELALARQRSEKATPAEYEAARKFGAHILASLNDAQVKVEANQREAARVSALKDVRIAELTKEIAQVKESAARETWTMVGAGLVILGGLACAFGSVRAGVPLLACGAFAGAIPFVVESPWFIYLADAFAAALAGMLGFALWERYVKEPAHAEINNVQTPQAPPADGPPSAA